MRYQGYDYSSDGGYFVTIVTFERRNLFGKIEEGEMKINRSGEMIDFWWHEIENKFKNILLDDFQIMPNHVHGVLFINNSVGADLCVRPFSQSSAVSGGHIGPPLQIPISKIIQWFKTMTANEYIKGVKQGIFPKFQGKIW